MHFISDWWNQTAPKQKMAQIIVFFMVFGFSTMITGTSHGIPMGMGIIYIIYDCIQKRSLSGFAMPGKLWLGFVVFPTSVVVSSLLLGDKPSIRLAYQHVYWILPLLITFYLGRQADVKYAAVGGAILSLLVSSLDMVHVNYLLLQGQKIAGLVPGSRLGAFHRNPNVHAMLLSGVLPLVFCGFWDKTIRSHRWFAALQMIAVVLGLWSLWKTGCRGGMFGIFAGGLFVFLAARFHEKIGRVVFAFVLTGTLLFSGYFFFGITPGSHGYDDTTRVRMLHFCYDMWKDHKWLGVGLANWRKEYMGHYFKEDVVRKAALERYMAMLKERNKKFSAKEAAKVQKAALWEEGRHNMPHNSIAWYFTTTGSIGGMGYIFFVLFYFYKLVQKLKEQPRNWMLAAGLWIFLAMSIHGLTDLGMIDKGTLRLLYLMLGLGLSYTCVENATER